MITRYTGRTALEEIARVLSEEGINSIPVEPALVRDPIQAQRARLCTAIGKARAIAKMALIDIKHDAEKKTRAA